jgi:hypothetical protein
MNNLGRNLRSLGRMSIANDADRVIQRSCIGRVVSLLTGIFIIGCIFLYAVLFYFLYRGGALQTSLAEHYMPYVAAGIFCTFILAIILAGLIGNALRRFFWRLLRQRMR